MSTLWFHNVEDGGEDARSYPGAMYYQARAGILSRENDVVVLNPELKGQANAMVSHYRRIGLDPSTSFVYAESLTDAILQVGMEGYVLSSSIFGKQANFVIPDERRFTITQTMNNKNQSYRVYRELGIKTPVAICFKNKADFKLKGMTALPFPVTFYKNGGASFGSAVGVRRCDSWEQILKAISEFPEKQPFQLQEGRLNDDGSLGVSMCSIYNTDEHGRPFRLLTSEQWLVNGIVHSGNIFPSVYESEELWRVTDRLFEYIVSQGYIGHCGFNLIGTMTNNVIEWSLIETNPRWQGSSYPTMISLMTGVQSWSAKVYKTSFRNLQDLTLGDIEFNPKTKQGVIIFSPGVILVGKLGLMICGDADYRKFVEARLKKIL